MLACWAIRASWSHPHFPQSMDNFKQWIANFTQYIKHGSVLANPGKSDRE